MQNRNPLFLFSLSLPASFDFSYLYRRGLDKTAVLEPADEPRGQGEVVERGDGRRDIRCAVPALVVGIREVAAAAAFFLASLLHRYKRGEKRRKQA